MTGQPTRSTGAGASTTSSSTVGSSAVGPPAASSISSAGRSTVALDAPKVASPTRLLSPERVRELSRLRPWRVVCDAAISWGFILGAWTMVSVHPAWWTVALAIPVVGNRYYALFILGHDAFHRRLFPKARWNDLFADVFIQGGVGAITRLNKRNHLAHHQHLATHRDPDRHKYGCFNKASRGAFLGFLSGLSSLGRSLKNVFWSGGAATGVESSEPASKSGSARGDGYQLRDVVILFGWQAGLIGGLSFAIGWWAFPVLWLAPVYLFTYLGDSIRSFCEHSQPYRDSEADAQRTITYRAPRWERALFSPMNMNYHAAHHLWPSIPYYNLPIADAEMETPESAAWVEWRYSYIGYLWKYFRRLPLDECRAEAEAEAAVSS